VTGRKYRRKISQVTSAVTPEGVAEEGGNYQIKAHATQRAAEGENAFSWERGE